MFGETVRKSYINYRCEIGADTYKEERWKFIIRKEERTEHFPSGNTNSHYMFVVYRLTQRTFMWIFTYWSKKFVKEFKTEKKATRYLLDQGETLMSKTEYYE